MSFSHAAVLNLANVSRETQVSRKTVEGYLEILEDLLLGFRIDVFTRRAKRELAAHPKFYFFDTGVFRANRPAGPLRVDSSDLTGLRHFAEDYPQRQRHLLYRREDRIKRNGVLCMPCEEFLLALRPDSFPD